MPLSSRERLFQASGPDTENNRWTKLESSIKLYPSCFMSRNMCGSVVVVVVVVVVVDL